MAYTRADARVITARVKECLEIEFGDGVEIVKSYYGESYEVRVRIAVGGQAEQADTARETWERYCGIFRLLPEHFGKTISMRGVPFRVAGLDLKRRAKPIVISRVSDDKPFICRVDDLARALGLKVEEFSL